MENKNQRNKKNTKKGLTKLKKSENTVSSTAVSEILDSTIPSGTVGNDALSEFNITLNPMLNHDMEGLIENFDYKISETDEGETSDVS